MNKKEKAQARLLEIVAEAMATILQKGGAKEVKIIPMADNDKMIPYIEFYIEDQYVLIKTVIPRAPFGG